MSAAWDGRPPNPEVEGWHWLQQLGELFPVQWNASRQQWGGMARWTAEEMFWSTYIGPASPDDARELRRLREGIEAILETTHVLMHLSDEAKDALRALLKGPTP